jgi:hypothetical protein
MTNNNKASASASASARDRWMDAMASRLAGRAALWRLVTTPAFGNRHAQRPADWPPRMCLAWPPPSSLAQTQLTPYPHFGWASLLVKTETSLQVPACVPPRLCFPIAWIARPGIRSCERPADSSLFHFHLARTHRCKAYVGFSSSAGWDVQSSFTWTSKRIGRNARVKATWCRISLALFD